MKDKKAVSEVVSYVMLIVIAITLSVIVFAFLRTQVPSERTECPDSVSVIIKDYTCANKEININFQNKGNFLVDGVFIKFSDSIDSVPVNPLNPIGEINEITATEWQEGFFYFGKRTIPGGVSGGAPLPLSPNRNYTQGYDYTPITKVEKVQFQPFLSDEETQEAIICEKAIVTQEIVNCD
tara:strand:+ start:192 stop:734 length:543 start_codon:yes stop_codon:yes gene_type:complete